jgi:hypothetical protein
MNGAPIFLLGMQRGGTNQVLNLLRSHPRIFWPQGEFHEVFRLPGLRGLRQIGLARTLRLLRNYAPIWWERGDILNPDRQPERSGLLAGRSGHAITAGLARSAAANRAGVARYKHALAERGLIDPEAAPDRMLVKVMNYNLTFVPDLAALYPGAVFVGLIRDGRAVCEGHVARGTNVAAAAALYNFVGRQLIELKAGGLRLRTWRFEDLLVDPKGVVGDVYDFCGLQRKGVRGVCLQDKERILDAVGKVSGIRKVDRFYALDEVSCHMRADANAAALTRLPAAARDDIERRCSEVLEHFGYVARAAIAQEDRGEHALPGPTDRSGAPNNATAS